MKKSGLVLAVPFFLSIGLSAPYADQKDSQASPSSQEVKKEVKDMASAKDTSMTKEKVDYQKGMQGELNEFKGKVEQLEAKEEMAEMHKKMDSAEEKLKSMKSASGEAWEKVKTEVDSAMESVKESYEKVAAHFK